MKGASHYKRPPFIKKIRSKIYIYIRYKTMRKKTKFFYTRFVSVLRNLTTFLMITVQH